LFSERNEEGEEDEKINQWEIREERKEEEKKNSTRSPQHSKTQVQWE
jgi:hypothetical protein